MESLEQQLTAGLAIQLYPGRLYFTSAGSEPQDTDEITYIGVPLEMVYIPFFADFGPLNLGHVVSYCRIVCEALAVASHSAKEKQLQQNRKLATPLPIASTSPVGVKLPSGALRPPTGGGSILRHGVSMSPTATATTTTTATVPTYKKVVLYSPHKTYERANTACLAGCFCVAILQYSPDYVNRLFSRMYPHFLPFRDASYGVANYNLYLQDCWAGFKKAWDLGWVSMEPWVESMGVERRAQMEAASAKAWAQKEGGVKQYSNSDSRPGTSMASKSGRLLFGGNSVGGVTMNVDGTFSPTGFAASANGFPNNSRIGNPASSAITQEDIRLQFESVMHAHDPLLAIFTASCLTLYAFDVEAYQFYERIENGDWNWIVPGQIMAFSSPLDDTAQHQQLQRAAISYVPMFRDRRVMMVVRLNEKDVYNELAFTNQGILHVDCNYADGSVPCDAIVERFLSHVAPLLQNTNEVGAHRLAERRRRAMEQQPANNHSNNTPTSRPQTSESKKSVAIVGRVGPNACTHHDSSNPTHAFHTLRSLNPHSRSGTDDLIAASIRRPPTSITSTTGASSSKVIRQTSLGGAVAVHCKAGLGRTGTLIAIYLMLHYHFTARECIGWLRICRPGCVLGEQQAFLEQFEARVGRARQQQQSAHANVVGASFLGDGGGVKAALTKGPLSPTKKGIIDDASLGAGASAGASSSSRPPTRARTAPTNGARIGRLDSANRSPNGLVGLGAALGTGHLHELWSKPLVGAPTAGGDGGHSSERDGSQSSHHPANSAAYQSGVPLTMRSSTPTTGTTLTMLKSLSKLGNAHLQRLPMNRTSALSGQRAQNAAQQSTMRLTFANTTVSGQHLVLPDTADGKSRMRLQSFASESTTVSRTSIAAAERESTSNLGGRRSFGTDNVFAVSPQRQQQRTSVSATTTGDDDSTQLAFPLIGGEPVAPYGSAHQQYQPSTTFGGLTAVYGDLLSGTASPPKKIRVMPPTGVTPVGDWAVARPGAPKKFVNM